MKYNWGFGIVVVIFLFMSFILSLVYKCSKQKVDLVSEKYYELGLNYQQKINELNNAASGKEKILVQFNPEKETVEIRYAEEKDTKEISGSIYFFKPDDSSQDFTIKIDSDEENMQTIGVSAIRKGWWKVQVSWLSGGVSYYSEKKLLIS